MLPANYQIECYDNAHALNHTAWSTLTKDDLFYQIDYLEEVEKTCKEFRKKLRFFVSMVNQDIHPFILCLTLKP